MFGRIYRPSSTRLRCLEVQPLALVASRGLRTRGQPARSSNSKSESAVGSSPNESPSSSGDSPPKPPSMENLLAETNPQDNSLLAPVHIPEDANAILKADHPSTNILAQSGIMVQRQIEMLNLFVGYEQANRYVILDPYGDHIGYMAEHDGGLGKAMGRQWFRTHRAFTTHVFDRHGKEVLRFHRPFSWINSRIRVYDPLEPASTVRRSSSTSLTRMTGEPEAPQQISQLPLDAMRIIGEAHSEWAPLRRKYNLFLAHDPSTGSDEPTPLSSHAVSDLSEAQRLQVTHQNPPSSAPTFYQFAYINEPFLSWDFSLLGADQRLIGSVNRSFRGFAREIFTDTGSYVLRMDAAGLEEEAQKHHVISRTSQGGRAYAEAVGGSGDKPGMTLDQRAVMLATAVTVDFDYFSRHSSGGGWGFMPLWMGGGEAGGAAGGVVGAGEAGGAVVGGAAGGSEVGGAVIGGAGRAVGSAAGTTGVGEGAIAGAGTMAGYEAMQRGMGREPRPQEPPPREPTTQEQPVEQPYDRQSPQSSLGEQQPPSDSQSPHSGLGEEHHGDLWGGDQDPWTGGGGGGSGGGGDGEGGGILSRLWDAFFGD